MNSLFSKLFWEERISRPGRSLKREKFRSFRFDHSSFPYCSKQRQQVCFVVDRLIGAQQESRTGFWSPCSKNRDRTRIKPENSNQTGIRRGFSKGKPEIANQIKPEYKQECKMAHKTPLFPSHKDLGARFMNFAGWLLPFSYTTPGEEHLNTRRNGGLFDVSHMGQLRVKGKNSLPFLQKLLPTDIQGLKAGQARYSVFCNREGGLIDDLIVYTVHHGEDYLLCVNSSAKEKDLLWIKSFAEREGEITLTDESAKWGMTAVQGPRALDLCEKVFSGGGGMISSLKKFHYIWRGDILVSRTGYTGEDGVELYMPREKTLKVWRDLVERGKEFSVKPAGLGARDTLRLEMAYLLSGQDFDESRTPLSAGLAWLMTNKGDFVGKSGLQKPPAEKLKGFIVEGPSGVPRRGCPVLSPSGAAVGVVTSGAKSPTLEKMIGLAYIKEQEEACFVNIHGSKTEITKVSGPFLKVRKGVSNE